MKKVRKILAVAASIIFFIIVGLNIFFPKIIYDFAIRVSGEMSNEIIEIINNMYILVAVLFIIIVINLIISIIKNEKNYITILNLIVIGIFILLNIFSAPIIYITDNIHKDKRNIDYRLDRFLTIIDIYSDEGNFDGAHEIHKYLYIPFSKKIIIFKKNIEVVNLEETKYIINHDYTDAS